MLSRLFAGLALALAASAASAQTAWPARPIKLVVPFAPGQVTDWLGRMMAEQMSAELGQPVVVENRAGANGTIGAAWAAAQPADGYTLVVTSNGTHSAGPSLYRKLAYEPVKGFAHIGGLMSLPWMLMVRPDFPAKDFTEFVAHVRANPGKLAVGFGSASSRLAIHQLRTVGGLDVLEVPYKGLGQTITDVRGGQLQFTFLDMGSAMTQEKGGGLRGLAVTSPQRSPVAPGKPSIAESMPGYSMVSWLALAAPAGTPEAIVARVGDLSRRILARPDIREKIAAYGGEPMPLSGPQMADLIVAEMPVWARFTREAGIEPE